jgi:mRNA interferase MazF
MVKQGNILGVILNPKKKTEGVYKPVVVISNNTFFKKTGLVIVCPIISKQESNEFPLHIRLDDRTNTFGTIYCECVRTLDLTEIPYKEIRETVPKDILESVCNIVFSEVELDG